MTRSTLLLLASLVPAISASGAQSKPALSDQQTLIKLERDWDAAFHRKDVAFIESVLAEEFVSTYGDGSRGDRAKELEILVLRYVRSQTAWPRTRNQEVANCPLFVRVIGADGPPSAQADAEISRSRSASLRTLRP